MMEIILAKEDWDDVPTPESETVIAIGDGSLEKSETVEK
jgi:hypothetical protein